MNNFEMSPNVQKFKSKIEEIKEEVDEENKVDLMNDSNSQLFNLQKFIGKDVVSSLKEKNNEADERFKQKDLMSSSEETEHNDSV